MVSHTMKPRRIKYSIGHKVHSVFLAKPITNPSTMKPKSQAMPTSPKYCLGVSGRVGNNYSLVIIFLDNQLSLESQR